MVLAWVLLCVLYITRGVYLETGRRTGAFVMMQSSCTSMLFQIWTVRGHRPMVACRYFVHL